MKPLIIAILLAAAAVSTFAQRAAVLRWEDEMCEYSGTYDPKIHTAARLRNTLKLSLPGSYLLETNTTAWSYGDIAKLDIAAFDAEYKRKVAELKALDIVNVAYWQDLKARKIRELEQVYKLERTSMLGYSDPAKLLAYEAAPDCVTRYARPLAAGGDQLLAAWLNVNVESRKNNADPDRLQRIFDQQLRSPDKMKFALVEVMNFGWSNCANALIERIQYDGTPEAEFKKLFKKARTLRCYEP
ncbi:MAG: hypothetical protein IPM59_13670 [Chloracidobacterium sp.]|nr:hypothetical protein [Chloracidobacterium sp.]